MWMLTVVGEQVRAEFIGQLDEITRRIEVAALAARESGRPDARKARSTAR